MRLDLGDWRLWIAIIGFIVSVGWLDTVRGRDLAVYIKKLDWWIEQDALRHSYIERRLERLEYEYRSWYGPQ